MQDGGKLLVYHAFGLKRGQLKPGFWFAENPGVASSTLALSTERKPLDNKGLVYALNTRSRGFPLFSLCSETSFPLPNFAGK